MSQTPIIIDGRIVRNELKKELVKKIAEKVTKPTLAIIQVGDRPDSNHFISAKKKLALELGITERHIRLPETATEIEIITAVSNIDSDPAVQGIIVQLPLPLSIDADAVISAISPEKDVDGLGAVNVKKLLDGRVDATMPATVRGVKELFAFYKIKLEGKHVVVVGRSSLVGKPMAAMCLAENATVTICHSKTVDLASYTRQADVLIVAVGKPKLIGSSYVRQGQVVIDVGITDVDGALVGDVDFEAVKDIVAAITPVPGGVGQMTVLALFENLVDNKV